MSVILERSLHKLFRLVGGTKFGVKACEGTDFFVPAILLFQELNDAQVSVVHVSGNSKNAADDKLRQAMRRYADVYTMAGQHGLFNRNQPPSILLISGDINFSTDLSDLRFR